VKSGDENILQHLKLVTDHESIRERSQATADLHWAALAKPEEKQGKTTGNIRRRKARK
jgi:hypothetical protein